MQAHLNLSSRLNRLKWPLLSRGFAITGKNLEGKREMEWNVEWKDGLEKWKERHRKREMINKDEIL